MTITKLVLKNLKKSRKIFILFLLTFLIGSIFLSLEGYILSRLISCFELTNKNEALHRCLFILQIIAAYYIIRAVINGYCASFTQELCNTKFRLNLMNDLFTSVHHHSVRWFDDEMSGRISSALQDLIRNCRIMFEQLCFRLVRPLTNLFTSFAIIATFSPLLSVSLFALNIPYFYAVYKVNKRTFQLSLNTGKALNDFSGVLVDSIANSDTVKYSGSFFTEQLYFYKHLKQALRLHAKEEQWHAFSRFAFHAVDTAFLSLSTLLMLFCAGYDHIAPDNLFFVYTTLGGMIWSIMMLNNFCCDFQNLSGSIKANLDILNQPVDVTEKPDAETLRANKISVSFQKIDFAYITGRPVFSGLSLNIGAGEKVGIVGRSGSGKSTLVNLLLRAYDVTGGKITLNRKDIRDLTFRSLHKNIAVVSQDTSLFNRSLLENLRIAAPQASRQQIEDAAKLANIHETIINLPNGYDSIVGERGVLLSGGERQRIAIARAILQNAPILILDEATSALDSESEALIEQALNNLIRNKTVIAIAHRLSTLKNMDRIIVLDKGKIAEDGSPQELLQNKNGIFHTLYRLQTNGYLTWGEEQ